MAHPSKSPDEFPPEYRAVALLRDRWFAMGILGAILTLIATGIGIVFSPLLVLLVAPAGFMLYAFARFAILDQRSGKLLAPWIDAHPYRGPAPKILGTLRRLSLTHPLVAALVILATLLGRFLLIITARHHLLT